MKLLILDGCAAAPALSRHIEASGRSEGAEVVRFALDDLNIAPCLGDFECWVKTPGRCRTHDVAQEIAQAIHDADLVVFATPLVFGGYAYALKKLLDRLIPLLDAFFHERAGLTRHLPRYRRYPAMLFVGLAEQPDAEARQLFAELAGGNAINLQAPWYRALLLAADDADGLRQLGRAIRAGLHGEAGDPWPWLNPDTLAGVCAADPAPPAAPRRATILIGSARPRGSSTSERLARRLAGALESQGVSVAFCYAVAFVKDGRLAEEALAAMLAADLLIVAAPLYVDALPALAGRALERLAGELAGPLRHPLRQVAGLLNSGFPEACHNRSALRILRLFARQNGLHWAGGLALGGGEILHGQPAAVAALIARRQFRALPQAAAGLAAGGGVPAAAAAAMARPLVAPALFRWLAPLSWLRLGRAHGVGWRQLHDRPLAAAQEAPGSRA